MEHTVNSKVFYQYNDVQSKVEPLDRPQKPPVAIPKNSERSTKSAVRTRYYTLSLIICVYITQALCV